MIPGMKPFVHMTVAISAGTLLGILVVATMLFFSSYGIDSVDYINEPEGPVPLELTAAPEELRKFIPPEEGQFPNIARETWAWHTDDDIYTLFEGDFGFSFERGSYEPEKITRFNESGGRFLIELRRPNFRLLASGPMENFEESAQALEQFQEVEDNHDRDKSRDE